VEEDNTGNMSIFAGFSTLDQIFGGGELVERNFNYRGIPRIFRDGLSALRGGGEYAQAKITVGQKETSYLLKWTKPYFNDTRWIVGLDLENSNNRQYSEDYQIDNTSAMFHATYPYNDFVKFGTLYRIRWTYVKAGHEAPDVLVDSKRQDLISAAGGSVSYDSTNHMTHPTCGTRSELLFEVAGLGGDSEFLSYSYLNSIYIPIVRNLTLKFRADARFLQAFAGTEKNIPNDRNVEGRRVIPLAERLFLGGETTVRGYRPFSIGPKFDHSVDPSGGASSVLLSEELQYRFGRPLATFVFLDAGMVSRKSWSVEQFRLSTGVGIRLEVLPSMPLTIGMGWPLNAESDADIQRFFFAVGARF
jgi:outer membrane protein insertion porin family